jgi:hypothetical protein
MRDKYHYKAYVAFRMRENCTECRSDNSGVLFNIRYGLGLYPDDPILRCRKRQLQHGHALILEHHGKLFQRQLYMRVLFKDLRQEETAGQNHRRSR